MIGFATHDGHCPVELLHKDETHHLMGEGHLGE